MKHYKKRGFVNRFSRSKKLWPTTSCKTRANQTTQVYRVQEKLLKMEGRLGKPAKAGRASGSAEVEKCGREDI